MQSFYQFMMRYVDAYAKDPMSRLGNAMHQDIGFPKQSGDFDECSYHMEMSSHYSRLMSVFDDAWHRYESWRS